MRFCLCLALICANAWATSEATYSQALRLFGQGRLDEAGQALEALVAADPGFARAWFSLLDVRQKQNRLAELDASLAASTNPGACLARMRRATVPAAFEQEARACAAALPDSFVVYVHWIVRVNAERRKALAAEFSAQGTSAALRFAAALASRNAAQLEAMGHEELSAENRNALDDNLYFLYTSDQPERQQTLHRLLARARTAHDEDWIRRVTGRLAIIARDQRRFDDALRFATEAAELSHVLASDASLYESIAGESLFRLGRPAEAINEFAKASASSARANDPANQATALQWMANQYNETGNHTAAVDHAQRALALSESNETTADAYKDLAFAWLALGYGPRALDAVRQAERTLQPPVAAWHARILADVAHLYLRLAQPAAALAAIDRSFVPAEKQPDRQAESRLLRGEALLALRRRNEVAAELAQAAQLAPEIPSYRARGQLTAGRVALEELQWPAARAAFERALADAGGFPVMQVDALVGLSNVELGQGHIAEALARRQQAIAVVERMRASLASAHRGGYLGARVHLYRDAAELLLRLGQTKAAFEMAERGRARELLDLTAEPPVAREASANALVAIRAATAASQAAANTTDRQKADLALQLATDRYLTSIAGAGPAASTSTLDEIQSRLLPTEAILHYTLGDARSSLFVIRRERIEHVALTGRANIHAAMRPVREWLTAPPNRLHQVDLLRGLRRLHQMLVAPAGPALTGAREWIVVSDGTLNLLPFEALVEAGEPTAPAEAAFLLKRITVRYAPSASLASAPAPLPPGAALLAYGDASTGTAIAQERGAFGRLPYSRVEVQQLGALYPRRRLALGADAGESAFKKEAPADVIHLAVHGFADERWPQMSGLVLSPDANDDGVLRVHEILALRLNARLVVLSACDSGAGIDVAGEGLLSLRRAFLAAGARSIVASSWHVRDRVAANLMAAFHDQVVRQRKPADALRRAQLGLIASGTYAHPYYWAVFSLMSRGK